MPLANVEERMQPGSTLYSYMDSPLGTILLARNSAGLQTINFQEGEGCLILEEDWLFEPTGFDESVAQLKAYFNGDLRHFDLSLAPVGTPFQRQVWAALQSIPYGETISYGEMAIRIGRPGAARAVGAANGKNPLPIVIPCHRVIGSNGQLTGYGGGLHLKEALLSLEQPGWADRNRQERLTSYQMKLF